ncbi:MULTISPECIES: hypothetical protein [unclassified Pseudoalteromonas]|uniref:hypothetical protein n=2 Tax=unclassified Pseudoalteromonas TaxID=194690 RepID=UPI00110CDE79|nr:MULTISPECIES: hypothetical protein [unclassified Pseudoalteromonas]MDN3403256.1 hypothetical protein [Pseudoalteromonas sp. APC 3213]TMS62851.1 hypothetical protein CWC10_04735 [Pseudoalteromonas sp. S3173]
MISNPECVFEVTYKTSNSEQLLVEQFRFDELADLKRFIKRYKYATLHVLNDHNSVINAAANTAFKYGVHLVINQIHYKFNDDNTHLNDRQVTIELITKAKELVFFKAVQHKLINTMLLESPLYYSEQQAIDSVKSIFQIDSYISHREMGQRINKKANTLDCLQAAFEKRRKQAKSFISISPNSSLIYTELDFEKHLIEYVLENDGLFVLNDKIGSGKTKHLLQLFEYFSDSGLKPIFVTPFVALTKKIIDGDRNYMSDKAKRDVDSLPSLATCIDSISAKRQFDGFRESSQITIVDEYEECINSFTQSARMGQTLTSRYQALAKFVKLLNKPKVILADALFCDLSIEQLQKLTNKKIHILSNSAAPKYPAKKIHVLDDKQHLFNLIEARKSGESMAIFNDASQQKFNKFKSVFEAITEGENNIGYCANAKFLRSKSGQEYLRNIDKELIKKKVHQFSPSITSGHSFEQVEMDSVNIFSNKTILPTQIIQSTGRFRLNYKVNLSFYKPNIPVDFSVSHQAIKNELIKEELYRNSSAEKEELQNILYVDVIVQRVRQQRLMTKNYCANTLLMLEHLGCEITYGSNFEEHKELAKKRLSNAEAALSEQYLLINLEEPVSEHKYLKLLSNSHWNTEEQEQLIYTYELINHYQLHSHPMLIEEALAFDSFGQGRQHISNIELIKSNIEFKEIELAYKKLVLGKLAKITGLLESDTPEWTSHDAVSFVNWLAEEKLVLNGILEPVEKYFEVVFNYTKISKPQPASTIKALLEKGFGVRVVKKKETKFINGKRPYYFNINHADLEKLKAATKLTSNDQIARAQGLLYFYKQSFPEFKLEDTEIKSCEPKQLERLLKFAQNRASYYDYFDERIVRIQSEACEYCVAN